MAAQWRTELVAAAHQYERVRRRDGASRWGIFHDTQVADRYLEIFLVDSWAEHFRQHERLTQTDRKLEQNQYSYVLIEPNVRHLIYATNGEEGDAVVSPPWFSSQHRDRLQRGSASSRMTHSSYHCLRHPFGACVWPYFGITDTPVVNCAYGH